MPQTATTTEGVVSDTPSTTTTKEYTPPVPSIRLLFSLISRRDFIILIFPAMLLSIVAGGVAPFTTFVVGQVFNHFAQFTVIVAPTPADKAHLRSGVGTSALELLG